jgi:hypothetical protein
MPDVRPHLPSEINRIPSQVRSCVAPYWPILFTRLYFRGYGSHSHGRLFTRSRALKRLGRTPFLPSVPKKTYLPESPPRLALARRPRSGLVGYPACAPARARFSVMVALAHRSNMPCIVMLMLIWFTGWDNYLSPFASPCLRSNAIMTNPLLHTSHRAIDGPAFSRRPSYGALPVLPLSNRCHSLILPQHLQTKGGFVTNNFPPIAPSCQLHHSSIRTTPWLCTFLPSPNQPSRPVRHLPFSIFKLQTAKLAHLFISRQANLASVYQLRTSRSQPAFCQRACPTFPSQTAGLDRHTAFAILGKQTTNLTCLFFHRQARLADAR